MTHQPRIHFGSLLAEGKTKVIYAHPQDESLAYMVNKDQITAGARGGRIGTGYYLKGHAGVSEGTRFEPVLVETFLKDDARHDPQIWREDIVTMGLAAPSEIEWMAQQGQRVFEALESAWATVDVT